MHRAQCHGRQHRHQRRAYGHVGDGSHIVTLDQAIETMKQTGEDMIAEYKESSKGGLAVNVVEC